jgi:hypothetical protein
MLQTTVRTPDKFETYLTVLPWRDGITTTGSGAITFAPSFLVAVANPRRQDVRSVHQETLSQTQRLLAQSHSNSL